MSLATRCTACGTIFRVVEDQLRVSDGWVRCGRCAQIFDARELLFDIERDAPPPWPAPYSPAVVIDPPPPPAPPPPAPAPAPSPTPLPPPPAPRPPPPPEPAFEPAWMAPPEPEPQDEAILPAGWPAEAPRQEPRWADAAGRAPVAQPPAAPSAPARAEPPRPPRATAPAELPDVVVLPEFMRRAERRARWNRPVVKAALGVLSLLLAALLGLQVTLHFRDALAALHPPLRAPLQALCGALDCDIHPWRRIEALSIDATSLSPVGSASYKLSLSLRNKSAVDVAAPWVELSLTDANGAPLARRVLPPDAMTPALTQMAAESEQTLSVSFSTGNQRVSGYSVNIFYP